MLANMAANALKSHAVKPVGGECIKVVDCDGRAHK